MLFTWIFSFYFIFLEEIEALGAKEIAKQNSHAKLLYHLLLSATL